MTINAYLTFDGNCEEAFNFYRSIFGGEFSYVSRFKEMPPSEHYTVTDDEKEKIMHMSLPFKDGTILMGSDASKAFGQTVTAGNNFSLSINATSIDEAKRVFFALAQDGQVTMPFDKTFWDAYYGMCIDKFGINWMVNFDLSVA